jgi:hypothetical protein
LPADEVTPLFRLKPISTTNTTLMACLLLTLMVRWPWIEVKRGLNRFMLPLFVRGSHGVNMGGNLIKIIYYQGFKYANTAHVFRREMVKYDYAVKSYSVE